jgi:hypothetical protein
VSGGRERERESARKYGTRLIKKKRRKGQTHKITERRSDKNNKLTTSPILSPLSSATLCDTPRADIRRG